MASYAAAPLQDLGGGEGHGQNIGEAVVGGLHRTGGLEVPDKAVPGVGVVQGDGDRVGVGAHAVMVQTPDGTTLAAAVMPQFREVFQGRRDGSAPSGGSTTPTTSGPEPRWW
jgi:hypothetical protein